MATKKTPRKSAKKTAKRAYNRKTAEAPKQKRKYTKRAKPVEQEVALDASQVDTAVKQDCEKSQGDVNCAESNSSLLNQIEVIDLRGADAMNRIAVLAMLDSEGYITEQLESPLSSENLSAELFADALQLNHVNKIISFEKWDNVSRSYRISRTNIRHETKISFSKPEPNHEQVINVGGAVYVRVQ